MATAISRKFRNIEIRFTTIRNALAFDEPAHTRLVSAWIKFSVTDKMELQSPPIICVVDDDMSAREALADLLESEGWTVKTFASGAAFLERFAAENTDCVVLDIKMPGLGGLDIQKEIVARVPGLPVIFVSGHGDIPTSVRAIKAGASEFLTKPYRPDELLEAVRQASRRGKERRCQRTELRKLRALFEQLTAREKEIMARVVAGRLNKQIAGDLGVSEITVKVYRRQLMQKMGATSLADLVRSAETLKETTN